MQAGGLYFCLFYRLDPDLDPERSPIYNTNADPKHWPNVAGPFRRLRLRNFGKGARAASPERLRNFGKGAGAASPEGLRNFGKGARAASPERLRNTALFTPLSLDLILVPVPLYMLICFIYNTVPIYRQLIVLHFILIHH